MKSINEPETNSVILENKKQILKKVITHETSEKVRYALESVVTNGTGRNAFIDGYRVGGKTGTAQKVSNGAYMVGNYIVSFIGFMPANDPKIIVYIALDNPKGVTQYGGTVAAPIARNILEDAIDILGIPKQKGASEKKYNFYEQKYVTVPNVVGMEINDALKILKPFKVEYALKGNKVIYQTPKANERVYEGETIKLLLE